ncbi:unnamed protein product [Pieris macdunnoughi]|uniref:Uncharacterized protein n=1 Tax=Pieris macdunnoughi TaxID=345717 RepID=A0A821YAS0_9NEOP|nr:unnamed protein product [Pieris macdunnoughi]
MCQRSAGEQRCRKRNKSGAEQKSPGVQRAGRRGGSKRRRPGWLAARRSPTPSHVSIRTGPPAMPPFLFPLPQCSYVSFPLYFLRPCSAAESYSVALLTKT